MAIMATGKYIHVRPEKVEKTRGGLFLPDGFEAESPLRGVVESVGEAVEEEIFPGDTVQFDNYGNFDLGNGLLAVRGEYVVSVDDHDDAVRATLDTTQARYDIYSEIEAEFDEDEGEGDEVSVAENGTRRELVRALARGVAALEAAGEAP